MARPDETPLPQGQEASSRSRVPTALEQPSPSAVPNPAAPLSKTRRKQAMHALQALGEKLVGLSPARLQALVLPEQLSEAIDEARRLSQREARRRQMQFIGRLMREIDPAPIEAQLARWREPGNVEKARVAAAEKWRSRLIDDVDALDQLCAQVPAADRAQLAALARRAADERLHGAPPHAYRELFRTLNALLSVSE